MARYVALLRGINVGGRTTVPMALLRLELAALGLANVRTHLNSGNALFESGLNESALEEMIERALEVRFGFPVSTLVRSAEEIGAVAGGLPFSEAEIARARAAAGDAESLYVAFLSAPPEGAALAKFDARKIEGEAYALSERRIYLLLDHSIRLSKLAAGLSRLDARATVRNWNTVQKLNAMLSEA